MNYDMKQSGERIQQLRIQHGYTQGGLARELNVDRSYLSRIESGKNGCSVDLFIQLSRIFNASLDYIILGQERYDPKVLENGAQLKADIEKLMNHLVEFKSRL